MATNKEDRPRVIVHILQSVDGRVAGSFFGEVGGLAGEYGRIRRELAGDCVIYGATTGRQLFARGTVRRTRKAQVPAGDFVAREADSYVAFVDPDGTLGFVGATSARPGMEGAHLVELLREDVDAGYLAYLREQGVSYVLAGRGSFDARAALVKLGSLFGVRRAVVQGGGIADGTFAASGCVDELSLVVAPVAQVQSGEPSLFETMPGVSAAPLRFELAEVRRLPDSGLWLHYIR